MDIQTQNSNTSSSQWKPCASR